jgi:hypothetical protein
VDGARPPWRIVRSWARPRTSVSTALRRDLDLTSRTVFARAADALASWELDHLVAVASSTMNVRVTSGRRGWSAGGLAGAGSAPSASAGSAPSAGVASGGCFHGLCDDQRRHSPDYAGRPSFALRCVSIWVLLRAASPGGLTASKESRVVYPGRDNVPRAEIHATRSNLKIPTRPQFRPPIMISRRLGRRAVRFVRST